jgi:nitrite reductase/ring-hydroxylating ferredoxin subunit
LAIALVGYVLVSGGAYLGGGMVFHMGVMINRNAYRNGPSEFKPAMAEKDLVEGKPQRVEVDGQPILLLRTKSVIYAVGAVCSHYGAPLEEGKLVDETIQCPWHLSRFSLLDGSVKEGPACAAVPCYDVKTVNGQVQVKMRD